MATRVQTVTIAAGQSLSDVFDCGPYRLLSLEMPDAWTVADVTLVASAMIGGTYKPVYDDAGTEAKATVAAGRVVGVDALAGVLASLRYVKLRSGTVATPVAQAAARQITLLLTE